MPALCGSRGPMLCLSGSSCNESSGVCDNCPSGFRDDQVLFKGNQNCGLSEAAITALYVIAGIHSTFVGIYALLSSRRKRRTRMKLLLLLIGAWLCLIPFYLLAHYLEGYRHGIAATIIFVTILSLVNLQVSIFSYTLESFFRLVVNNGIPQKIEGFHMWWFALWMLCKIVSGMVMLAGAARSDDSLFNGGQMAMGIVLLIEVMSNVLKDHFLNQKLVKSVKELHNSIQSDKINPVVKEFADRVEKSGFVGPFYGAVFFLLAGAYIVLYSIYRSAIPYAYVIWAMMVVTWPLIGVGPLVILKTSLGRQMDRSKTNGTTSPMEITGQVNNNEAQSPGGPSTAKSPRSEVIATRKKTLVEDRNIEDAKSLNSHAEISAVINPEL